MEFFKCRDVRLKGLEKRIKPVVVATTAKYPASSGQISRYCMQPTYMRSVSFGGNLLPGAVSGQAVAICLNSLTSAEQAANEIYLLMHDYS